MLARDLQKAADMMISRARWFLMSLPMLTVVSWERACGFSGLLKSRKD